MPPSERLPDEAALAGAWRAGDRAAFDTLVLRFEARLMSYLMHICSSRAEAEDLFQETFLRVFKDRENLKPETPFAFYLMRIARNLAVDRGRHRAVERKGLRIVAARPVPKDEEGKDLEPVRRAVAELPEDLREVVTLKIWGGLNWNQVGEMLGYSPDTATRRFAEALKILSKKVTP